MKPSRIVTALLLASLLAAPVYAESIDNSDTNLDQTEKQIDIQTTDEESELIDFPEPCFYEAGDLNGDDSVTQEDLAAFARYLQSGEPIEIENADTNNDGIVNIADYINLKSGINVINEDQNNMLPIEKMYSSSETKIYKLKYGNEKLDVYFDPDEQEVLEKLNTFRVKYGLRKNDIYYRALYVADSIARHYENGGNSDSFKKEDDYWCINGIRHIYFSLELPSENADADAVIEKFFSNKRYSVKGMLLQSDLKIGAGHSGKYWTIIAMH